MKNGLKKAIVVIYVIFIVILLAGGLIISGGDLEKTLLALLMFGPMLLGGFLGVLLVKAVEKRREEKLGIGELKFYIGVPVGVLMLVSIFVMLNMK